MKSLLLVALAACMATPKTVRAQVIDSSMVRVGMRVRLSLTETILPSPYTRVRRLRKVIGTVQAIESDTIRLALSPSQQPIAVPRILIYTVERSLGSGRAGSAQDAALIGGGVGVLAMGLFSEKVRMPIFASGYAIGALVG